MESAEQHDASLNQAVEGATQPEAQKSIPLTEDLRQIGVNVTHIAGSTFDELMSGEGGDTRDRIVSSRNPIKLALEKLKKLRFTQKRAV